MTLEVSVRIKLTYFWATVCKTVRPVLSDRCLSCLSVCDVGVLWPNGWMHQDKTWHGGRPRPTPHCVTWGPSSPKRGTAPNFRPMSIVAKRSPIWDTTEYLFVQLVMVALCNRADYYIFALLFLSSIFYILSSFFPRLISAAAGWMSTILWHMVWP